MSKVKGKDFVADTDAEYDMIIKLLTGKDKAVYNKFVKTVVRAGPAKPSKIKQRISAFRETIKDLRDRQPDDDVKEKLSEFADFLETYRDNKAYKKGSEMSFNPKKLDFKIVDEEEEEELVFGTGTGRTSTSSGDPVSTKKGPATIIDRYEAFVEDDPQAYYYLKEMIKTPKDAEVLRKHIASTYGYTSASPLHIKAKYKADEREKIFNDHFERIAFLKGLTSVPANLRKESGKIMNEYILKNDPQGLVFKEKISPYVEDNGNLKPNLKVKDLTKLKGIVNTRLALLGHPKIPTDVTGLTDLRLELGSQDYAFLIDAYKEYPHLEHPEIQVEREEERASITPEEEVLLGGEEGVEEYLNNKYGSMEQEELIKNILVDDKGKVRFEFQKIKPEPTSGTLMDVINQMIIKQRMGSVIDKLKNNKSFKENTPDGRKNIVAGELRNMKITAQDITNAVTELNKEGVIDALSEEVYGEVKPTTIADINRLIQSVNYLNPDKKGEVRRVLENYIDAVEPIYEQEFNVKISPTVNAPSDIRVLPKGVVIKDVDEPRTTADIYKEKIQQLKDISVKKVKAVGPELQALLEEEAKAREWIKDNEKEIKKMEKAGKEQTVKTTKATRRKGFVRPHLLNPTEQAVDAALNKTTEEQIQDFSNWFVFDVPIDQTGVGTTFNNPFVKQNEVRYREITDGNIFSDFNKTYDVKPDLFGGPKFYEQHARLTKEGVNSEINDIRRKEEEDFIQKLNKNSNGLFTQDQTREEVSNFKNIYQTPNDFFTGTLYPFQDTANRSIYVSDFDKNLNYFIEP
jgi:hypothetical protein